MMKNNPKKPAKDVVAHTTILVITLNSGSAGGQIQSIQSVPTAQIKKSKTVSLLSTG